MRPGVLSLPEGRIETAWWGPGPAEAPTIVLLHEGLGCVALWRDVPERLAVATGLGVFAYSRFGYGQSDPVTLPRPVTYMHHEGQIVLPRVLTAAGIRDAVLVGHSDGGSIAAVYAGMVGASFDGQRPAHTPRLHALITIAAHFFVEDLNIVSIRQIRDSYATGDLRARLARYHRDPDIAFHGWNGAWLDPRFRDFDITVFLPPIRVPTLGLQGADDPYGTEEQLRVMQSRFTAPIRTRLIPNARHAPHLEAKEETLDAITAHIRQSVS
jgi:pimeloyl-ACP methyl ester carboxylesterase